MEQKAQATGSRNLTKLEDFPNASTKEKHQMLRHNLEILSASIDQGLSRIKVTVTEPKKPLLKMKNQLTQTEGKFAETVRPILKHVTNTEEGGENYSGFGQETERSRSSRRSRRVQYFSDSDTESGVTPNATVEVDPSHLAKRDGTNLKDNDEAQEMVDDGSSFKNLRMRPLPRKCSKCVCFKCGCVFPVYQ